MSPSKKDATLLFLQCESLRMHLDPTVDGVILPSWLIESGRPLRLDYNIKLADLIVDDRGISATLTFKLLRHPTFVPWDAVFCIVAPEFGGMVWNDDVPDSLDALMEPEADAQVTQQLQVRKARPDWLRVV